MCIYLFLNYNEKYIIYKSSIKISYILIYSAGDLSVSADQKRRSKAVRSTIHPFLQRKQKSFELPRSRSPVTVTLRSAHSLTSLNQVNTCRDSPTRQVVSSKLAKGHLTRKMSLCSRITNSRNSNLSQDNQCNKYVVGSRDEDIGINHDAESINQSASSRPKDSNKSDIVETKCRYKYGTPTSYTDDVSVSPTPDLSVETVKDSAYQSKQTSLEVETFLDSRTKRIGQPYR